VIRGALEPLMEMLGFTGEHNRAIIRAVDEAVSNIMRHSYHGRLDQPIEIYCSRLERRTNGETEQASKFCSSIADPQWTRPSWLLAHWTN